MEKKLKQILDEYEEQIVRYENEINALNSKIAFCVEHNFKEEERIARVQFDAINMLVYRWRRMHNEIKEVWNAWMS